MVAGSFAGFSDQQLGLATHHRIVHAGERGAALVQSVPAMIAADAKPDAVRLALLRLARPLGIDRERAPKRDPVGFALGDQRFGLRPASRCASPRSTVAAGTAAFSFACRSRNGTCGNAGPAGACRWC